MADIGRYIYQDSSLQESCAALTSLTEKELCCQVKTYGAMLINKGNLTLLNSFRHTCTK